MIKEIGLRIAAIALNVLIMVIAVAVGAALNAAIRLF